MKTLIFLALVTLCFAAEYNHDYAEDIFQYSRTSYCKEEILKAYECESCKRHPEFLHLQVFYNDSHNAQGYCGYDQANDRIVLAIRGSVDTTNYINDLNAAKTSYDRCNGCQIHKGFYETYENLANNLLACAYTLHSDYPQAPFIVTGHSLGAAQSALAGIEIKQLLGVLPESFYLFGCPRVGDEAFANYIEKELAGLTLYRVVHNKDTITHLPAKWQGFSHFGVEIFYDANFDKYTVCAGREDSKCSGKYTLPAQWSTQDHLYMFHSCAGCTQEACANM